MQEWGVKPEIEAFDPGMIANAAYYLKKGILKAPLHFQFCMGCANGIPGSMKNLIFMKETMESLCPGSTWSCFGVGHSAMEMLYGAVALGGHIRVGMEDNVMYSKGVMTEADVTDRLSHIHFTNDIDSDLVKNADLVIEAVFEDMKIKRETFAKLEARCAEDTIFCTNSSVMSPSEISRDLKHRERFVGTHFWNPGHLIPLVEVVKSDASSDETAQTVMEVLRSVGKKPVLCKNDVPGFIANRMQHALWREAISIVEHGIADAATVDEAVKYSFGLRLPQLGPMENADMVGTDLTYNIHDYILQDLEDTHTPSPLLKQLRDEGKIGFKTGEGFQKWTPGQVAKSNADLNEYLIRMLYGK